MSIVSRVAQLVRDLKELHVITESTYAGFDPDAEDISFSISFNYGERIRRKSRDTRSIVFLIYAFSEEFKDCKDFKISTYLSEETRESLEFSFRPRSKHIQDSDPEFDNTILYDYKYGNKIEVDDSLDHKDWITFTFGDFYLHYK